MAKRRDTDSRHPVLRASRVGVEVHELVVGPGGGLTSSRVDLIQTPGEAEGLWIRRPAGSDPTLWVANTYGGIRAFGFRQ